MAFVTGRQMRGPVAALAAVALLLGACTGGGSGKPSPTATIGFADCEKNPTTCNGGDIKLGGAYTYGLEQPIANWNVNTRDGASPATRQAMSGLLPQVFKVDPQGRLQLNADLVSTADITNQNPETIVYKIRPDAVWSDGIPISADDFVFAWKQNSGNPLHCAGCTPAATAGYDVIKSIVGSDGGKTVTVTFIDGKTYGDWKGNFSSDGLYPSHLATKQGFDLAKPDGVAAASDWFARTVPTWSGGPYQIDAYNQGQSVVLKKNDKWYGKIKPSLDTITFKFVTDPNAILPALKAKELTGMSPQPSQALVAGVAGVPGVIYEVGESYAWEHLTLNVRNKYLADPVLRRALFTAVSVKTVVEKTYGAFDKNLKPLGSHNFVPGDTAYKDVISGTGQGTGDSEKAKKLLTDAGYKLDNGRLSTKAGEGVPTLRLRYDKGNATRAAAAELISAALKNVGIDAHPDPSDGLGQTLTAGDFDLVLADFVNGPLYQGAAERRWATGAAANYGGYSNAELDRLVHSASIDVDPRHAADLLNQADDLLTKDAYVLPLMQRPTLTFTYSEYANIRDNPSVWGPTYNIQEWGLRSA
ncbi:ABC transporter family substrate-binding protein [Dactylosporangium sp. McL0621]|uniref:ABC transporter family substrate-binding protein n=1 Tax=Dactylosporangium sp. McL0621 TaxID=3415678 RepID=UPI003CEE8FA4